LNVSPTRLKEFCTSILEKHQIPENEAEVIADSLVDADLIGVKSHGVTKMKDYLNRLNQGIIERETKMEIIRENPTATLFHANNGWGQYAGKIAMDHAIEKAKQYGSATVGVSHSNHFGTASYFTRMAAEQNLIGIAMTNTSPVMVSWGSQEPTLGTNPLCIAVPTNQDPIILDMATSNVARGKINLAVKNGEDIPEGWAITENGEHTTDAKEALKGYLLPLGPKGSGLAMMIDILTGVMTGSLFGKDVPRMYDDAEPQHIGHLFIVIDPESFLDIDEFKAKMDERIEQTRQSTPAKGVDRVHMPGDMENLNRNRQLQEGLELSEAIFKELKELGESVNVKIEEIRM
jgi:LDH2 family malate/lactate/ureidoglycolate dehydrogenase